MKTENIKNSIIAMLNAGSNIATIEYKTAVKTAAKYKDVKIEKTSRANIMMFKSLKEYTDVYSNAVKKTASKIESNDSQKIDDFEKSDSYFIHDKICHSIVYHKANNTPYLFAIFNKSLGSIYTIDGIESTKNDVSQYLTPSEAKKLLGDNSLTYNVKNDIVHAVIVRTIKLENIISVNANKAKIEFKTALAA
jgi:hypothetical protein